MVKKQILFVDDEINILKGLQRSLRPLRNQWEMVFVNGPHSALKYLEKGPFDVVVSDMRMPQMDGACLMEIVQKKYPTSVRIILSGHSDQDMIMNTVKTAHQYLSKPCEKETLVSAIERACALRDLLNQEVLKKLIGGIDTMPSLPSLYTLIINELQSESASAASVGEIISSDMGMSAKILQLVNSSFFGTPRHISSVKEAVVLLGFDIVKTLVLGVEVFSSFEKKSISFVSVENIHKHCIRTGEIANVIARIESIDKEKREDAIISGMLHDLGKLLLVVHFPKQYKESMAISENESLPAFSAEKQVFGVTHAEVGAYLLGLWGLPRQIIEGIAFHHEPLRCESDDLEIPGLIHISEILEKQTDFPDDPGSLKGLSTAFLEKHYLQERLPEYWQAIQGALTAD